MGTTPKLVSYCTAKVLVQRGLNQTTIQTPSKPLLCNHPRILNGWIGA